MLALITTFFNPTNSETVKQNYFRFRKVVNYPVTTVELAFEDHPFCIDDAIHIRGTQKNVLWQKERLLNIALESISPQYDKIAWVDGDIIFENPNWHTETERLLENLPVVQLFEISHEPQNPIDPVNHGMGVAKYLSLVRSGDILPKQSPKMGLGWAARRELLVAGFFDKAIIGGGDILQLYSWLDWITHSKITGLPPNLHEELMTWKTKSSLGSSVISGRVEAGWGEKCPLRLTDQIGFVTGTIEHLPHGRKHHRQYSQRANILIEENFCPKTDIILESNGLFAWGSHKPRLHQFLKDYFRDRKVDQQSS